MEHFVLRYIWWAGKREGSADEKMAEVTARFEEQGDESCRDLKAEKAIECMRRKRLCAT